MGEVFEQFRVESERFLYRKPYLRGGRWRVRRRDTLTGRVEQVTLQAETLREAKQEIVERASQERAEAEQARLHPQERRLREITLDRALTDWSQTFQVRTVTLKRYLLDLQLVRRYLGADRYVHEVSLTDIEDILFRQWKTTHRSRTKLKHLKMLCRFFDWCVAHGYCIENPARKLAVPLAWRKEALRSRRSRGRALTVEEARRLLKACETSFTLGIWNGHSTRQQEFRPAEYLYLFVLLGFRAGLRLSNIQGLRWGDIDLEKKILRIEASRMKNDLDFEVPIHDELALGLEKRLKLLDRVPSKDERVLNVMKPYGGFKSALGRAGIDSAFRIHDLRHTFATWLGQYCTHSVMQRLMGHAPSSITDIYAQHQDIETLRKGLAQLPWLVTPSEQRSPGKESTA